MNELLGVTIIFVIFGGLFLYISKTDGLAVAIGIYSVVCLFVLLVTLAVVLITG